MTAKKIHSDHTGTVPPTQRRGRPSWRRSRHAAMIALTAAGLGAVSVLAYSVAASASTLTNCAASPATCGFPTAASTGPPAGTALKTVPGQVSSGPGWKFVAATSTVEVTGDNAVLSGLYIPYNLDINSASHVTITGDQVVTGGNWGVSLRHTAGVTIENTTISGQNATTGRVNYAIDDIYGDSTGMVIKNNDISDWRIGVNVTSGNVTGNYIHHPGYLTGDHTDGIFDNGGSAQLTISGNTILNNLGQTDAILLDVPAGETVSNKTITGNLLAGGSYTIYLGGSTATSSSNILVQNNRFGQQYYPKSGQFGPATQYSATTGNAWSGNVWDSTGLAVAP
jgi:hypothetical protein